MTVTLDRPVTQTRPVPPVCPDGLPWCVEHDVDSDGFHTHRTATIDIGADRNGFRTPHDIPVMDAYAAIAYEEDGTADPVVWLSAKYPLPKFIYPEDGFGFSAGRAREIGLKLIQLGGHLDGTVVAPVPRFAPGEHPCEVGTSWCNDEQAASDEDHTTCWSGEQYLPATGGRLPDGGSGGGAQFVSVLLERTVGREANIALNVTYTVSDFGLSDAATMTLDQAEQLALYLLAQVEMLRGGGVR